MPTLMAGDYSRFPTSTRETFPYVLGEVCELRDTWEVYHRLFMHGDEVTSLMGERLGGILAMLQGLMQDDMFLSISRLTDNDSSGQSNLSFWSLLPSIADSAEPAFGPRVTAAHNALVAAAANIRRHRHKRLAHFDLSVSLKDKVLPIVTFKEIRDIITQMQDLLNEFDGEFGNHAMFFDSLSRQEATGKAEVTALKAKAYDQLESEGVIPHGEWRNRAKRAGYP